MPPLLLTLELLVMPLAAVPYYWHLPILIVVISLVYSATRFDGWKPIVREAVRWGLRLSAFLFVIVAVLYVVATYL
jgi:hypothetical protein